MLTLCPPGPGGAVDVDLEVVLVDLDVDLLDLGHHRDGRGRGVDPTLRFGLRHALDAVRTTLVLEDREGAVPLDREDDLLESARLALVRREQLGLEAAALRVAGQHPVHVAGPDRRLVAADALTDLDDHVLLVGRIVLDERELELLLDLGEPRLRLGDELLQLGIGERCRHVLPHRAPLLRQLVGRLELLQAAADLGGLAVVVVDRRVRHAFLHLGVRALELVDQVLECVRHGS